MPWRTTTVKREPLYREVWAEAVRSVAKRYGVSDVGPRKICGKLGVPLAATRFVAPSNSGL